MIMENPYGGNVNPSQHAAWEHGHTAGKTEQAEIVKELVGAASKITSLGYMTFEDAGNLTLLVEETEIEELLYDLRQAIEKAKAG